MAASSGDGSAFIPYSSPLSDNGDLDLQDIDQVELALDGTMGGTYNVSFFGRAGDMPIPEPPTAMLAAAGVAGLAMLRRRRAG